MAKNRVRIKQKMKHVGNDGKNHLVKKLRPNEGMHKKKFKIHRPLTNLNLEKSIYLLKVETKKNVLNYRTSNLMKNLKILSKNHLF